MSQDRRRASCPACLRPQTTCICDWIRPTANELEVLILQHPLEVAQAKGSARLLQLSLSRCTLLVGETLDATQLASCLSRPMPDGRPVQALLLYPDTAHVDPPAQGVSRQVPHTQPEGQGAPTALRLVVIDGTWRKSLKMLHANPLLAALPRLSLDAPHTSCYALLRKAPKPGQMSTLEATCLALAQLEGQPARYASLLAAFDGFVLAAKRSSSERQTTRLRPPRLAS